MTESENITIRQVDDMLIASIRFRGEYDEVPQRFRQLYEQVRPYVTGKGMLLHHYFDQSVGAGHDQAAQASQLLFQQSRRPVHQVGT